MSERLTSADRSPATPPNPGFAAPVRSVDALADRYVDQVCAADPFLATNIGVAGYDAGVTDYSPEALAASIELDRATLRALQALEPVDFRETVAKAAMVERLESGIAYGEAGLGHALNSISSPAQGIRQVFDLMNTDTVEDWTTIAARLELLHTSVESYGRTVAADVAAGRPPAVRQVRLVATQCDRTADGYFRGLVAKAAAAGADAALMARLEAGAATAERAYADFGAFLREQVAPHARQDDALGPELYPLAIREFLGDDVDVQEAYAWGFEELARLEDEMTRIAAGLGLADTLRGTLEALDADPKRTIFSADDYLAWSQSLCEQVIAAVADKHFTIPAPLRRIENRFSPQDDGIYYTGPSEDLSRPGRVWWSHTEHGDYHPWREASTVFHEGVPGHHLQVGIAVANRDLNRYQRLLCFTSGHGEGWALYAERLMGELGWLEDPATRLGMLDAQRFRAARVCVDMGVHNRLPVPAAEQSIVGPRWTAEGAMAFMRHHSMVDPQMIEFEVNRYLGWPGQAPSYKLGERLWLSIRAEAMRAAAHDDRYDNPVVALRAFHDGALAMGSLGLRPMREHIAEALGTRG